MDLDTASVVAHGHDDRSFLGGQVNVGFGHGNTLPQLGVALGF